MSLADTPQPPYYVVIFSSIRENDDEEYQVMAEKMDALAKIQSGFLGFETVRGEIGLSISYWESIEAIQQWKNNAKHLEAQSLGQKEWYKSYKVRIGKVEREYSFEKPSIVE